MAIIDCQYWTDPHKSLDGWCAQMVHGGKPGPDTCRQCAHRQSYVLPKDAALPPARAVTSSPRISLVIPARNEEPARLLGTIASLGAYVNEVIVIDDSSDPAIELASLPAGTRLHRNPVSLGCSGARNVGVAMATGDVVVTSDAHVTIRAGDFRRMCEDSLRYNAIIQPGTVVEAWPTDPWCCYGAKLSPMPPEQYQGNFTPPKDEYATCTGLYGSVYACPTRVWETVGNGLYTLAWGLAETGKAVIAGMCKVPILVSRDVKCSHYIKKSFGYTVPTDLHQLNWWLLYHAWSSSDYWQYYWEPTLRSLYPRVATRGAELTSAHDAHRRWNTAQARRKVSDDEFWQFGKKLRPLGNAAASLVPDTPEAASFFASHPALAPATKPVASSVATKPFVVTVWGPGRPWLRAMHEAALQQSRGKFAGVLWVDNSGTGEYADSPPHGVCAINGIKPLAADSQSPLAAAQHQADGWAMALAWLKTNTITAPILSWEADVVPSAHDITTLLAHPRDGMVTCPVLSRHGGHLMLYDHAMRPAADGAQNVRTCHLGLTLIPSAIWRTWVPAAKSPTGAAAVDHQLCAHANGRVSVAWQVRPRHFATPDSSLVYNKPITP